MTKKQKIWNITTGNDLATNDLLGAVVSAYNGLKKGDTLKLLFQIKDMPMIKYTITTGHALGYQIVCECKPIGHHNFGYITRKDLFTYLKGLFAPACDFIVWLSVSKGVC